MKNAVACRTAVMLFAGLVAASSNGLADSFAFTIFEVPPAQGVSCPGSCFTHALGINDSGQIVGQFDGGGFMRTAGASYTTINYPTASGPTIIPGINSSGQITGWYHGDFSKGDCCVDHGFSGTFTTFNVPPALSTRAFGINGFGQIVGEFDDPSHTGSRGFLRSTDGNTFTIFDVPGGSLGAHPNGINHSGQIVGFFSDGKGVYGFLRSPDGNTFTTIVAPGDREAKTIALGINDSGQIVGLFADSVGNHGFLRDSDGITFSTVDVPGANSTEVFGINNSGQIVGIVYDATGQHGFVGSPCTYGFSPPTPTSASAAGGSTSVALTLSAGSCAWAASSNVPWITGVTPSGLGSGTVNYTVAPNMSSLGRTGTLTIVGKPYTINQAGVACTVGFNPPPPVSVPAPGGNGSVAITLGASDCSWSSSSNVNWISNVSPSGIGSGTVNYTVAANVSSLGRTGTLMIAGKPYTINQAGVACTVSFDPPPPVRVAGTGGNGHVILTLGASDCSWSASSNVNWISNLTPSGIGNGTANYTVAPNTSAARSGTITIAGQNYTINEDAGGPDTTPPFGAFDTPLNGADNVVGAVGVTGWTLDNVGAARVEIYRDPVGNEQRGNFGLVFIGIANFVAGARPDVQNSYPTNPNANRAGWGYQLLTDFLPGKGNGTFKLHAFAYDAAGNVTELGAPGKSITCTNSSAAKPFGTIDTPGQGETISGNNYVNFGWALTPPAGGSFIIPLDGSTISVIVDGAPVGHPTYNQFRSDIAALFPGYTNSNGAVGYYYLDTTKYLNGVHTISWNVFDNMGRGEGIGSRYFGIANSGPINEPEAMDLSVSGWVDRVHSVRRDDAPFVGKRAGLRVFLRLNSLDSPLRSLTPGDDGSYVVTMEQLERLELHLGSVHDGYVRFAGGRQPLPVGSTLDPDTGIFYWQTTASFLGDFDLEFIPDDGARAPVLVRVRIVPQTFK